MTTCENGFSNEEPKWLDKSYLEKIISNYEDNPVKDIKKLTKEPATSKGENYASAMNLVQVEYTLKGSDHETHKISLIVKSCLEDDLISEIVEQFNVFERESQVYQVIMKKCEDLLKSIGDETKFGPRPIYVDKRIIVQENLKEKGYRIVDVKEGLDFDHCQRVLQKLAKFHACTMVLHRKEPEIFRYHLAGNLTETESPLHGLYTNAIATCIEYCKTNPDLQKYVPKLLSFQKVIIQKVVKVFTRAENGRFNVLTHGDAWVNNFMYKKGSDGHIDDVLLVDYQEGYYGSPGIDWNYFMFTSWQESVYIKHKNQLIEEYHKILSDTLYQLKYDQQIPTLEDVKTEIQLKAYHGLVTATCLLPILIGNRPDLADISNFLSDTETARANRFVVFNNPKYGNLLKLFLKDFVDCGIL